MTNQFMIAEIGKNLSEPGSLSLLRKTFWQQEFNVEIHHEEQFSEGLKKKYQVLLLDSGTAKELVSKASSIRVEVNETQFADVLMLADRRWWLYGFLPEALALLIVKKCPALNTHRMAYVTGDNSYSMMAAVTAIKLGFKNIVFVVENFDVIGEQIVGIKKKFFDLSVNMIRDSELTLQSSNGSLLMNTLLESDSKNIVEDLTYLNFIENENSLIVEIPFSKNKSIVLQEAEHGKLALLQSSELWALRDFLILEKNGLSRDLPFEEYLKKWEAFLQTKSP